MTDATPTSFPWFETADESRKVDAGPHGIVAGRSIRNLRAETIADLPAVGPPR